MQPIGGYKMGIIRRMRQGRAFVPRCGRVAHRLVPWVAPGVLQPFVAPPLGGSSPGFRLKPGLRTSAASSRVRCSENGTCPSAPCLAPWSSAGYRSRLACWRKLRRRNGATICRARRCSRQTRPRRNLPRRTGTTIPPALIPRRGRLDIRSQPQTAPDPAASPYSNPQFPIANPYRRETAPEPIATPSAVTSRKLDVVEFREQPLGELLRLFCAQTGYNIVASPEARKVEVSLYLHDVTRRGRPGRLVQVQRPVAQAGQGIRNHHASIRPRNISAT